jgi:hypothetical protein
MGLTGIQGLLSIGALCLIYLLYFAYSFFLKKKHSDMHDMLAFVSSTYILCLILYILIFKRDDASKTLGSLWKYPGINKTEGFQTVTEEPGAVVVPAADTGPIFGADGCNKVKEVLNNYLQVKKQNPSIQILNLDETIEQLQTYLKDYSCDQY